MNPGTLASEQPSAAALSDKVAAAERCDAGGDHERAIDLLAAACRDGDVEAMTRLGKRLLTGANAPHRPADAVVLLTKAADLGGAEAAAQYAVLAAIGVHVEQSWNHALAAIVFAAERGSPAARGQLAVLSDDVTLASEAAAGSVTDPRVWARLAQAIDLDRWHRPAEQVTLSESPDVRRFPTFAPPAVCDWMIGRTRGRLVRALVYDAFARKEGISTTRTNTWAPFDLVQSDLVSVLIQARMCASMRLPFRFLEPLTVLHYDAGEEITEHYDFVDPHTPNYERELAERGQRIVTFLLYLNDGYDGGETEMPRLELSNKGSCGEGLAFVNALPNGKPDERTLHAGRPPRGGEKWIVSQFFRDRRVF